MVNILSLLNMVFMAPRIEMIVTSYTLKRVYLNECASFQSDPTDLDHALVVCDLTQSDNQCGIKICRSRSKRRSFVLANSLPSEFKQTCHLVRIVRIQYGYWPFLR